MQPISLVIPLDSSRNFKMPGTYPLSCSCTINSIGLPFRIRILIIACFSPDLYKIPQKLLTCTTSETVKKAFIFPNTLYFILLVSLEHNIFTKLFLHFFLSFLFFSDQSLWIGDSFMISLPQWSKYIISNQLVGVIIRVIQRPPYIIDIYLSSLSSSITASFFCDNYTLLTFYFLTRNTKIKDKIFSTRGACPCIGVTENILFWCMLTHHRILSTELPLSVDWCDKYPYLTKKSQKTNTKEFQFPRPMQLTASSSE